MRLIRCALSLCILLHAGGARAQDPAPAAAPLRVFIECNNTPCDSDFFRTEITFVDHVRERQNADVHLLMTGQSTGSGGREITFSFFGQDRFKGRDHILKETFVVAASEDAVRRGMVRVMSLGLVPYALDTPAAVSNGRASHALRRLLLSAGDRRPRLEPGCAGPPGDSPPLHRLQ